MMLKEGTPKEPGRDLPNMYLLSLTLWECVPQLRPWDFASQLEAVDLLR